MAGPRTFIRLLAAAGFSNLADGLVKVGLPLIALQSTRSPAAIAGLTVAFTLPWLVLALPAGAIVDRVDRRHAMLAANTLRAASVAVAAAVALTEPAPGTVLIALYAVAVSVGIAETVHDTAAQALVPQVVSAERLSIANGRLYAVELTANEFVGPPLAGLLAAVGAAAVLGAPAALWVLALVLLGTLGGPYRPAVKPRSSTGIVSGLVTDVLDGLRFLGHHRLLRRLALVVGMTNLATSGALAVLVLQVVGPGSALELSATAYGLLLAATAAGSVVGSVAAERIERLLGRRVTVAAGFAAVSALVVAPAALPNGYAIAAAFALGGAGVVVSNVVLVTLRQRTTPDHLLGRVTSSYRLVAWGTMPLGAAAAAAMAHVAGVASVFWVLAVLPLGAAAIIAFGGRLDEDPPATSAGSST